MTVQNISAVTLAVQHMARAVEFYEERVGLRLLYGGGGTSFTSFRVGDGYLNLILATEGGWKWWGRIILYVDNVDVLYQRLVEAGLNPSAAPQDATWGERYFHILDPDSHEISFAQPLGVRGR